MKTQFQVNTEWTEQVDVVTATADVSNFIDSRDFEPERKKRELANAAPKLVRAVQYGYLSFGTDGSVIQHFRDPLTDVGQTKIVLSHITYVARVKAEVKTATIKTLQPHTVMNQIMEYAMMYTGQPEIILSKLDGYDADLMNTITPLFF